MEQNLKNFQKEVTKYWIDVFALQSQWFELNKEFAEKLAKSFKDTYNLK